MKSSIDRMIDDVLRREGSRYTDDPVDRGGPTKYGITQATLSEVRNRKVSAEEVEGLTEAEARAIYRKRYYYNPAIDRCPAELQPFLFDAAVNHGPKRSIMWLQMACNKLGHWDIQVDGSCGPVTQRTAKLALHACGTKLLAEMVRLRRDWYRSIVLSDQSQGRFLAGWLNRVAEFEPDAERKVEVA